MSQPQDRIIQCPACEWQPDGNIYWQCSCGHRWNTFETKAKCPACNLQWADTRCPGCGTSSPHANWYKDPKAVTPALTPKARMLKDRKYRIESRLMALGIKNYRIGFLQYLDHTNITFQIPYEAGCRMIILTSVSYAACNLDDRPALIEWLKDQNLWTKVSPHEQQFFFNPIPEEKTLQDLSWRMEGALILAWALNLIPSLREIDGPEAEEEIDLLFSVIPAIGEDTGLFLNQLTDYRDLGEIFEENLVNELATTYFRDLLFNGHPDETAIDRMTSFERHTTLNWLRKFSDIEDWDNTDTST